MAATDFVLKSGLTVGFSLDEAAGASAITIVGGPEVVSEEAEQSLRNLGHQVDRIGGDLTHVLDALYDLGNRRAVRGGRAAAAERPAIHTGKAHVILSAAPAPRARAGGGGRGGRGETGAWPAPGQERALENRLHQCRGGGTSLYRDGLRRQGVLAPYDPPLVHGKG